MKESLLLIGGGILASLASNALFGRSIGAVSGDRSLDITPRSPAFGIWGVIYTLLVICVVYIARGRALPSRGFAYALGASLVLSAIWVPAFVRNTPGSLLAASLTLWFALAAALVAVHLAGPLPSDAAQAVAVQGSAGLYAGWLCCAAVLGTGIAMKAQNISLPSWSLFALALGVSLLSVITRNPVLAVPAIWAIAWQNKCTAMGVGGVVSLVTGVILSVSATPKVT